MLLSKEVTFDYAQHLDPAKMYRPWVELVGLYFDVETTALIPSIKLGKDFESLTEDEKEVVIAEKTKELDEKMNDLRIVQFCGILVQNQEVIRFVNEIIDPEIPIPEEASKIHGIKNSDVVGKMTFKDLVPYLRALIKEADYIVAYNGDFDKFLLEKSISWFLQDGKETKVFDPTDEKIKLPLIDPHVWVIRRKQIDRFTKVFQGNRLGDIAKSYSVSKVAAVAHGEGALHDAMSDTEILVELTHKMLERGDLPWALGETIEDQVQLRKSHIAYHGAKK